MRLRHKSWARPELEASPFVKINCFDYKGKWQDEFKNNNPIHLELGCGMGSFISQVCVKNPNANYVAIDLKDEVLANALRKVVETECENVRLIPLNIQRIEDVFDKDEISKIYINFCNPWPKDRHKKRRLTHTRLLTQYKKFIKPGTEIWFKTDDRELFVESQDYFKECGFDIKYLTYDLHNSDFKENIVTEYESKFSSMGMNIMFLIAKLK